MKKRLTPLAAIVMTLSHQVQADDLAQMQTVQVTAAPIVESNSVDSFSGFSTRVSESQIKDLGALDLAASLRMTPGVQISRYNEVGSYSGDHGGSVFIRGMGMSRPGSEIKTYLDGIPLYMGIWNHPLIDLLPLNGVKSVDVQKSPQNMVSGNNFAAINLHTKRATQEGHDSELNASFGSFATQILQANRVGRMGDLDYSVAGSQIESDGARANGDGRLRNAMGRLNRKIDNIWTVGASFVSVSNKVGDPGSDLNTVGSARNDSETNLISAFAAHQQGDWRGEFKIYQNKGHNNVANDTAWGDFVSNFNMSGFRWREEFVPWKNGQIIGGIDQEGVNGAIEGPYTGGSQNVPTFRVTSPFVGLSHNFAMSANWVMQPSISLRTYRSSQYASKTAYQTGVSFISKGITVYANYAEALLYPGAETFAAYTAMPGMFTRNNSWQRLVATENQHSEVGAKWVLSDETQLDVSVFNDSIRKRYKFDGGDWAQDATSYRVNGVETSLKHHINSQWVIFTGWTALDSSLSTLPYAPKTALSAGVNGRIAGYRLSLDAQHQTSMYSSTQSRIMYVPGHVDGFTVANARVAMPVASLGKKGEVYALINNLFDRSYQYNAGYPMPGRNVRVGVTASF